MTIIWSGILTLKGSASTLRPRCKEPIYHMTIFSRFTALKRAALLSCVTTLVAVGAPAHAQETPDTTGWFSKTLSQTKNRLDNIVENGDMEVYLSGYAYHGRHTYTKERI